MRTRRVPSSEDFAAIVDAAIARLVHQAHAVGPGGAPERLERCLSNLAEEASEVNEEAARKIVAYMRQEIRRQMAN